MSKYIKLEDAIERLNQLYHSYEVEEWLKSLPTIEVSEDCISKEYLKSFEYINKGDFNSVETIREWIDNAPSVVPTQTNANQRTQCVESVGRAEGEWVVKANGNNECSICGREKQDGWANFCGFCGAKMKGAEDEFEAKD